jgi:hypothetical protein
MANCGSTGRPSSGREPLPVREPSVTAPAAPAQIAWSLSAPASDDGAASSPEVDRVAGAPAIGNSHAEAIARSRRPPSPDSLCSTARPTLADGGRPSWSRGHGVPGSHGPGPGACLGKVNNTLTPTMSAAPKPGYRSFLLNLCLTSSRTVASARRPSSKRGHEVPGSHGAGPRACTVKVNRTLTPTTNRAAALGRCSSFVIDPIRKQCDRARLHPSFCPGLPGSTPPVVLGLDPRTHGVPRPAASPGRCATPKRLAVSLDLTDKMGPRVKPEDDSFFSSLRRSATLGHHVCRAEQ